MIARPTVLTAALAIALVADAAAQKPPAGPPADEGQPARVAGRSLADWASDVDSEDRVVRLRAMRSLAHFEAAAGDALVAALASDDAAVRYIAAVQLGRIGGPPLDGARDRLQPLRADDPQAAVQLAAAYALCRAGAPAENLDGLINRLGDADDALALSAAELLGMLGPAAKAAVPQLQQTLRAHQAAGQGDPPLPAAVRNALGQIQPDALQPDALQEDR